MIIHRKPIYGLLATLSVFVIILGIIIVHLKNNSDLKVVFLNIGQGDAILIENGDNQLLIDGGNNSTRLLNELGKFMPFWDKTIEVVMVTHPDSDHFAGLINLPDNYQVKNIIRTNAESHSQNWKFFTEKIQTKKIPQFLGKNGTEIIFPNKANVKIIFPFNRVRTYPSNTNLTSLVAKLNYGKNSFLFTGDLPFAGEKEIIKSGTNIQSNVLKVGHHGSKYSTGNNFLDAVNPKEAVISVGIKNRYHHPSDIVLNKLHQRLIKIWRTDLDGNIVYNCRPSDCQSYSVR